MMSNFETIALPREISDTTARQVSGGEFSVLQNVHRAICNKEPFAHMVIDECLPGSSYRAISESFPFDFILKSVRTKSNKRYDMFASWGASPNDPTLAPAPWRAFMEQNATADTARTVCALLTPHLSASEARFFQPMAGPGAIDPADIRVRVSIGVNTPAHTPTSVRGAHCDNHTKAFVGLYYLKDLAEGDAGGDLLLYRWKPGRRGDRAWPAAVADDDVEVVATITYAPNRLVVFMNTDDSLHGVSSRLPGKHFRRLVVISGWFPGYRSDPGAVRALGLSAAQ